MDTIVKGEPIAFRPDKADEARLETILKQTRLTRSDLARRAMHHVITKIETEGSVSFLFGFEAVGSTTQAA